MEFKKWLCQTIREIRKKSGLTQSEAAEKIGYSQRAISRWENGEVKIGVAIFTKYCAALGFDAGELIKKYKILQHNPERI